MMPDLILIALIPILPFLCFLVLGLTGKKLGAFSGLLGTASMAVSAGLAMLTAFQYFFHAGKIDGVYQKLVVFDYQWLTFTPEISINMGILLDPISVMMLVVVTFVSLMVHLYSLGYMKGEERFSVFYAFLSLFTFSMLGLVLSSNLFQIYIFWELVGVSSFLLIGFYYNKPSAVSASKKAFIVTRFADLGFLIGILILGFNAKTLNFGLLIDRLIHLDSPYLQTAMASSFLGMSALTWGLLLVFIGGAGKSAMFPLHVWLPDAMEGPTPVSALIHAATMVVAGVFLVARLFPIFILSCPAALDVVAYVGVFSSLFAAIIACTQTDIKRVLAYSTMSQIGYMMFALGVSGYEGEAGLGYMGSMFHLFTHAMFKALLFLGAGSVIHYIHSNEMKDMGGLRKSMPITHITFLIACLAIAGIPPFAGFFSKEEILAAAFHKNPMIFYVGLFTAAMTAFYMFRLYFSIFWSKPSHAVHHDDHHHGEGPVSMMLPLLILAACSVVVGFIPFGEYVSADGNPLLTEFHPMFSIAPVSLALGGILLAMYLYKSANDRPDQIATSLSLVYSSAHRKFFIDEIYLFVTKRIIFNLLGRPAAWIDRNIVDGLMNLIGNLTSGIAEMIRGLQSGKVQGYAIWYLAGVLGFAVLFIYLWY